MITQTKSTKSVLGKLRQHQNALFRTMESGYKSKLVTFVLLFLAIAITLFFDQGRFTIRSQVIAHFTYFTVYFSLIFSLQRNLVSNINHQFQQMLPNYSSYWLAQQIYVFVTLALIPCLVICIIDPNYKVLAVSFIFVYLLSLLCSLISEWTIFFASTLCFGVLGLNVGKIKKAPDYTFLGSQQDWYVYIMLAVCLVLIPVCLMLFNRKKIDYKRSKQCSPQFNWNEFLLVVQGKTFKISQPWIINLHAKWLRFKYRLLSHQSLAAKVNIASHSSRVINMSLFRFLVWFPFIVGSFFYEAPETADGMPWFLDNRSVIVFAVMQIFFFGVFDYLTLGDFRRPKQILWLKLPLSRLELRHALVSQFFRRVALELGYSLGMVLLLLWCYEATAEYSYYALVGFLSIKSITLGCFCLAEWQGEKLTLSIIANLLSTLLSIGLAAILAFVPEKLSSWGVVILVASLLFMAVNVKSYLDRSYKKATEFA